MRASSASSRSPRRLQRPLSQDVILDAAVALIEAEGPAALTMRRLGSALGVEAMAIYHHFANREELLRAIGDRMLERLGELDFSADWRDACRRFATVLREVAVAQPATFQLLGMRPLDSPTALRPVERLLGVLITAGFSPIEALGIYRATVSYSRGYALAETTGFTVDAAQFTGRRRLAELPQKEFPILAGRARELAGLTSDAAFVLGLEGLLTGLPDPKMRARGRSSLTNSSK